MQDGTTPHKAKETIWTLHGLFGEFNGEERIISESVVYANNPHDLGALK
jgi:hypothetical protein